MCVDVGDLGDGGGDGGEIEKNACAGGAGAFEDGEAVEEFGSEGGGEGEGYVVEPVDFGVSMPFLSQSCESRGRSLEQTWLRSFSEVLRHSNGSSEAQRKDLLGLEGEGCYGGVFEAGDVGICYICDVDEYGGCGHGEIEAIGEVQVRGDFGADDEMRVERRADGGDAGDGEWGERDLGKGDPEGLHLLGGCYRAVKFDVSGEGFETEFEGAAFEEVNDFLGIINEVLAAGELLRSGIVALGNEEFAL